MTRSRTAPNGKCPFSTTGHPKIGAPFTSDFTILVFTLLQNMRVHFCAKRCKRYLKETRPKLVAALKGKRIAGATSSSYHSAAWTTDGEVWSFGHKKAGIALGHAGVVGDPGGEEVPRLILHHL